jgi:hypothetical protein
MPNYFHLLAPVTRIAAMTLWLAVYMSDFFCIVWIQQLSYACHSSLYNNVKYVLGISHSEVPRWPLNWLAGMV